MHGDAGVPGTLGRSQISKGPKQHLRVNAWLQAGTVVRFCRALLPLSLCQGVELVFNISGKA